MDSAKRVENLRRHELAMAHISAIRELLRVLSTTNGVDYSIYENTIPEWTEMVLNYANSWDNRSSVGTPNFSPTALAHLQTLCPQIAPIVPRYTAEQRESLTETFDSILTLLVDDNTLPKALQSHFALILGHMKQTLVEYNISGDFELYRANVTLTTLVEAASKKTRSKDLRNRWREIGLQLVWPTVATAAIEAGSIYAQYQLGMLT